MVECFIALGGNFPNTHVAIRQVERELARESGFSAFRSSSLYLTSPVSDEPQSPYLNKACAFESEWPLLKLWPYLEQLEKKIGKVLKPKNAPRLIDVDLIFYGTYQVYSPDLIVPHPRWQERLFVLVPLRELTHRPDVLRAWAQFKNKAKETIINLG